MDRLTEPPHAYFTIVVDVDNGNVKEWKPRPLHVTSRHLKSFKKLLPTNGAVSAEDLDQHGYVRFDVLSSKVRSPIGEIYQWLDRHIGRYRYIAQTGLATIWFLNEDDLTLFLLRWASDDQAKI